MALLLKVNIISNQISSTSYKYYFNNLKYKKDDNISPYETQTRTPVTVQTQT